MLLHNDKELFHEVVISTAEKLGLAVPIVEKDYSEITTYFQHHPVSYESAIETVRTVAESGMFE